MANMINNGYTKEDMVGSRRGGNLVNNGYTKEDMVANSRGGNLANNGYTKEDMVGNRRGGNLANNGYTKEDMVGRDRDGRTKYDGYTKEDQIQKRATTGCWSTFAGCVGGMWATRQIAKKEDKVVYVTTTLRELVVYIIFLGILCTTTFAIITFSWYYYTRVLNDVFIDTPYLDTRNNLRGSTQVMDFWRYVQNVLLDGIYWEYWHHAEPSPIEKKIRNVLYENRLLGVPRMRQLRVSNNSCEVPESFQGAIRVCYAPYNEKHEDKVPFGLKIAPTWTYQSDNETGSMGYTGKLATYSGAGYYVDFKTTKNETRVQMQQLRENLWIDRGTRVVFIDFTIYNANINLFCVAKIIVEFPPTGGIIPSWSFKTVKLIRYVTTLDYFVMACELVFLFFVLYYMVEEALEIAALKSAYFKSIWNILDLVVIGLSLMCIGFNIYSYLTIEPKLKKLIEFPEKYANFEEMGYWQVQFNSIVAVCVFFSWFKLFKYISFNKTMTQLSSTLSRCAKDVAGFAIMFFIVFFAFSQFGFLLFGTQVYDFHTFIDSVFTLLRTILGDFNFREIEEANRILGPMFFLSYVFFVFFILLNMFLAIINDTYSEVKAEIATQRNEFEIADYFKRGYNNMIGKIGKRDKIIDIENAIKSAESPDGIITFGGLRRSLKQANFSDVEIEMFFAKYDMDGNKFLDPSEIKSIFQDLERQRESEKSQDQRPLSSRSSRASASLPSSSVQNTEIMVLNKRVDLMEHSVASSLSKIEEVLFRIDQMEMTKLKKKEAISKIFDDEWGEED